MNLHRVFLVANTTKPDVLRTLANLKVWCQQHGVEPVPVSEPWKQDEEDALVIALGGDGTVLRAASYFSETVIPILGVNLGSLGFLTQATTDEMADVLQAILSDRFLIEERMRLAYHLHNVGSTVLNDLVITGSVDSPFCELELSWEDGIVSAYPGDGVILATATGSTAYSLSAGGPVIVPPAACILATPLAAHKLGLRPVIFPPDETIRVRARTRARVFADGDAVATLACGDEIVVARAANPTRLIRIAGAPTFFRVLDEKLNWADTAQRERED